MSTLDCCYKHRDRTGNTHLLWLNVPGYIIFQVGWIKVQPHPVWLWIRFMLQWPWQYFSIKCWGKENPKLKCWLVCGKYLPCLKSCRKHTHSAHTHILWERVWGCVGVCMYVGTCMCLVPMHTYACCVEAREKPQVLFLRSHAKELDRLASASHMDLTVAASLVQGCPAWYHTGHVGAGCVEPLYHGLPSQPWKCSNEDFNFLGENINLLEDVLLRWDWKENCSCLPLLPDKVGCSSWTSRASSPLIYCQFFFRELSLSFAVFIFFNF